ILTPRPTSPTLFPYTTLFRSDLHHVENALHRTEIRKMHEEPLAFARVVAALSVPLRIALVEVAVHEVVDHLDVVLHLEFLDGARSEEHTSELQSQSNIVCRLL